MRAIYIILVGLPCWPVYRGGNRLGLHYLILDDGLASLISVWALVVMGFGHRPIPMVRVGPRPNTCGLRPSKLSLLRSRPLGQVSKGLGLSVVQPSLQRSRPLGRSVRLTRHRAGSWVPTSPSAGTVEAGGSFFPTKAWCVFDEENGFSALKIVIGFYIHLGLGL